MDTFGLRSVPRQENVTTGSKTNWLAKARRDSLNWAILFCPGECQWQSR